MKRTMLGTAMMVALAVVVMSAQDPVPTVVNQKLFEPTYRAAKALQGATTTGLTYDKYSELLQALATELSIVKDQRPTGEQNSKLLALFNETFGHYEAAGVFWKAKLDGPTRGATRAVKGIPIYFEKQKADDAKLKLAESYQLPITKANAGGVLTSKLEYRSIPDDSPQRVWTRAAETLGKATDLYYGR